MVISYKEMQKNHALKEYVEPLEIEKKANTERLRQYYRKRISELEAATDEDSKTLIKFYRRLFIKQDGVKKC